VIRTYCINGYSKLPLGFEATVAFGQIRVVVLWFHRLVTFGLLNERDKVAHKFMALKIHGWRVDVCE